MWKAWRGSTAGLTTRGASRSRSSLGGVFWAQEKVTWPLGFLPVPSDLCPKVSGEGLRAEWLTGPGCLSAVPALPSRRLGAQCVCPARSRSVVSPSLGRWSSAGARHLKGACLYRMPTYAFPKLYTRTRFVPTVQTGTQGPSSGCWQRTAAVGAVEVSLEPPLTTRARETLSPRSLLPPTPEVLLPFLRGDGQVSAHGLRHSIGHRYLILHIIPRLYSVKGNRKFSFLWLWIILNTWSQLSFCR